MPRQRLSVAPIASTRSVGAVPAVGGGTYARGTCAAERSAIAIVISVRDDANGIRACDSRVMPCHVVDNDITPSLQWVTTSRQQAGGIRKVSRKLGRRPAADRKGSKIDFKMMPI